MTGTEAETDPRTPGSRVRARFCLYVGGALVALVIVAVVTPNDHRDHRPRSSRAIYALKAITTAQMLFHEGDKDGDGTLDYATLAELSSATLVDAVLGSGRKDGYVFQVRPSATSPEWMWMAVANPEEPGPVTGERYLVTNHAGIIYYTGLQGGAFELNDACEIPPGALPVGK
jgi:hypothetical protein